MQENFICVKISKVKFSGGSRTSQGRQPDKWHQPIIWPKFAENCMTRKKIGRRRAKGVRPQFYNVDPPLKLKRFCFYLCLFTSHDKGLLITNNIYLSLTKCVGNCIGSVVGLLFTRIVRMLNTTQRAPSFNIVVPGDFDSLMQF